MPTDLRLVKGQVALHIEAGERPVIEVLLRWNRCIGKAFLQRLLPDPWPKHGASRRRHSGCIYPSVGKESEPLLWQHDNKWNRLSRKWLRFEFVPAIMQCVNCQACI